MSHLCSRHFGVLLRCLTHCLRVVSFLDLAQPRRYLASLGAVRELDGALRFVEPNVHRYTAEELLAVAKALAKVAK